MRGATCGTCLRKFATRSKLIEHLHARSPICYVNLMVFAEDLPDEEREAEDWAQWEAEAALRARGLKTCYSEQIVKQCEGPLKQFVIPIAHSRQSRYALFRRALKRRKDGGVESTKEVDFDKILEALAWTDGACIQDVVAMDVLEALWEL